MKAFPRNIDYDNKDDGGMDLRDYFAAAALTGLCANYEIVKQNMKFAKDTAKRYDLEVKENDVYMVGWLVKTAYDHADLMMKERSNVSS